MPLRRTTRTAAHLACVGLLLAGCSSTSSRKTHSTPTAPAPPTAPAAPTAKSAPAAPIALSDWSLILPVNADGAPTGKAASISPAVLKAPWLTEGPDHSLTFWAPAGAAKTANSQHSRTELVHRTDFAGGTGTHTMHAELTVDQAPDSQNIIVGQIHGGGAIAAVPFVMLHYRAGTIDVEVKQARSGSQGHDFKLLTGVSPHTRFSYDITAGPGDRLSFTATDVPAGTSGSADTTLPAPFEGADLRFAAGDYEQDIDSSAPGIDGGRVTFTTLTVTNS
ncbi:polysaccharide lyase family 7 protein [Embleya sp. AB8]|uniref:polysaccharide lyase family 7 protein n=1 Tax=Embleya sp. AB8 TaxID=3156304 RepID=UPI003C74A8CB